MGFFKPTWRDVTPRKPADERNLWRDVKPKRQDEGGLWRPVKPPQKKSKRRWF